MSQHEHFEHRDSPAGGSAEDVLASVERDLNRIVADHQADRARALDDESPLRKIAHTFFANNWSLFCENLLSKTSILRVTPEPSPAPLQFWFELDRPYKCKRSAEAPIELCPGPIRGMICYRPDLFARPRGVHVAVQIDPTLGYLHPNCSRRRGSVICLGHLPEAPFPLPLDLLVENHIYPIVTYQNMTPSDALDREAAMYFALDPEACAGLRPVPPLY